MPEAEVGEKPDRSSSKELADQIEESYREVPVTSVTSQAFVDIASYEVVETDERRGRLHKEQESGEKLTPKERAYLNEKGLEQTIVEQRIIERLTSVEGYQEEYNKIYKRFHQLSFAYQNEGESNGKWRAAMDFYGIRNLILYPGSAKTES